MESHALESWNCLIRPYKIAFEREDGQDYKASVIVEPLEKGFGLTLGNALRRVLLSSIQGSAVIAARISGAVLEFSHLSGVVEDIPDIILNLKALKLRLLTDNIPPSSPEVSSQWTTPLASLAPRELAFNGDSSEGLAVMCSEKKHLESSDAAQGIEFLIKGTGPGVLTAKDIQGAGRLEVLDPNQVICTLGEGAEFEAYITVARGKGYYAAPIFSYGAKTIGEIMIDACFSPIRCVSYRVERTRIAQSTDYDLLILTVETNGAITPKEAISEAATILQEQLKHFVSFRPQVIDTPARAPTQEVLPSTLPPALFMLIKDLDLPVRCYNCLKNANIVYVGDLVKKKESDLLRTPNFGRKSLNDIYDVLARYDLTLGMSFPDWPPESALMSRSDPYSSSHYSAHMHHMSSTHGDAASGLLVGYPNTLAGAPMTSAGDLEEAFRSYRDQKSESEKGPSSSHYAKVAPYAKVKDLEEDLSEDDDDDPWA